MNSRAPTTDEQCLTRGRRITDRSPVVISGAREEQLTRDKNRYDALSVKRPQEIAGVQLDVASIQFPRRCLFNCGFLLSGHNDLGPTSVNHLHSSNDPIDPVCLSGSEDESAHPRRSMNQHHRNSSYNHSQTAEDASIRITSRRDHQPREMFALIGNERILVAVAEYGWRTFIRRERPTKYVVRFENAAGGLSGELHIDRSDARQLVREKCKEAVWFTLRPRSAWPGIEATEVDG
jgi:hypothetical protein